MPVSTKTITLTSPSVEQSTTLVFAKRFEFLSESKVGFRLAFSSGGTYSAGSRLIGAENSYYQEQIDFTGTIWVSTVSVPSATVANCTITLNSSTVSAASGAFSSITLASSVTGSGIPAGTIVLSKNASGSQIVLGNSSYQPVLATASSTGTLTISGNVILCESWS